MQDPGGEASMSAGLQSTRDPPWDVGQGLPEQEVHPLLRASLLLPLLHPCLCFNASPAISLLAASTALPLTYVLFLPLHTLATDNRDASD